MRAVDHFAREDDLIAKLHRPRAEAGKSQRARAGAGLKVDVARHQPRQPDRGQQRAHRQILAIRDEVRLVIATDDARAGVDRENGVAGGAHFLIGRELKRGAASQQQVTRPEQPRKPRAQATRVVIGEAAKAVRRDIIAPRVTILEEVPDNALGPEQQPRRGAGATRLAFERVKHQLAVGVAALVLADVRLDDADAGSERIRQARSDSESNLLHRKSEKPAKSG